MAILAFVNFLCENRLYLGIFSIFLWYLLYLLMAIIIRKHPLTRSLDKSTQLCISEASVSHIQGIVCGTVGIIAVIQCRHDIMNMKHKVITYYFPIGTGYFIYDVIVMYYGFFTEICETKKGVSILDSIPLFLRRHSLMVAHHIILISLLFPLLMAYSPKGHFFAGCFCAMEMSSPFVNARIIFSKLKMKNTNYYFANGVLMMLTFFFFRVVVFPYMYGTYVIQEAFLSKISFIDAFSKIPFICHLSCLLVLSPQVYWVSLIIKGVYAAVVKKCEPKKVD